MVMTFYKLVLAFWLLCISMTLVSTSFLKSDSFPEQVREDANIYPQSSMDGKDNTPLALDDVFQHRVDDDSQLCPKKYMLFFLLTGNTQHLRDCGYVMGITKPKPTVNRPKPFVATYSGNILKRILDNMESGTAKVDIKEDLKGASAKRARLSINGALSSLVDMLQNESRRHRRPQFAFHREMLNMG